jgi:hypothetical protein
MAGSCSGLKHKKVKSLCQFGVFLCGPLRISAISALKRLFQRRDRRDTQRTAEKNHHLPTYERTNPLFSIG